MKSILRSLLFVALLSMPIGAMSTQVTIATDPSPGAPARHGLLKLRAALQARSVQVVDKAELRIVAGLAAGSGPAAGMIRSLNLQVPSRPESLLIRKVRNSFGTTLLLAGSDNTGLMYALLDVADRLGWNPGSSDLLADVREATESPDVAERCVSIYTMHGRTFEKRFHDERYWERFLDLLAQSRFNEFGLLFGYETSGFMAPMHPWFYEVPGFPGVRVPSLTPAEQEQNLRDLNRLIRMVHDRGMKVKIGLWDQICRLGRLTPSCIVEGLDAKNLTAYSQSAIRTFFKKVPDVDLVQFRIHTESGLTAAEMLDFWDQMFDTLKQVAPEKVYEARAKDFQDDLMDLALQRGLKFRMDTKVWAEQVGLPYHPTHIQRGNQFDRRHTYADMLQYPRKYDMHWTLWTAGTVRALLWGDPAYARRFVKESHLYDSPGFDINEPLATKMQAQPHDREPFDLLTPKYRYTDYEFERWWHMFQVFGRVGYNPATPDEVWDNDFVRHLGKAAAATVEQALHRASQILPRIIAYNLADAGFPTTRGWAEKQRRGDLREYATAQPSDTAQFESFDEHSQSVLEGQPSVKHTLPKTGEWFARAADDVATLVKQAEAKAGPDPNRELVSTLVDLRILTNLARYHSRRIPAGIEYNLFMKTGDVTRLDEAIRYERAAVESWRQIVLAAGDVYAENMMMGRPAEDLTGHWKDSLAALEKGLVALAAERAKFHAWPGDVVGKYDFGAKAAATFSVALPNDTYEVEVVVDNSGAGATEIGPMWLEANGRDVSDTFAVPTGQRVTKKLLTRVADGQLHMAFNAVTSHRWRVTSMMVRQAGPRIAHVPVRSLLPGQDLELMATVSGSPKRVRAVYGSAEAGFASTELRCVGGPVFRTTVPAARIRSGFSYYLGASDEQGRATWPIGDGQNRIAVRLRSEQIPPVVKHEAITSAKPGSPLTITAQVQDPSEVEWVRVRYRSVNQHQDLRLLPMLPTGRPHEYRATIPGEDLDPRWDFMYYIETMDRAGNGTIFPDLERQTPYVFVRLH